jgi:hypothetical protein
LNHLRGNQTKQNEPAGIFKKINKGYLCPCCLARVDCKFESVFHEFGCITSLAIRIVYSTTVGTLLKQLAAKGYLDGWDDFPQNIRELIEKNDNAMIRKHLGDQARGLIFISAGTSRGLENEIQERSGGTQIIISVAIRAPNEDCASIEQYLLNKALKTVAKDQGYAILQPYQSHTADDKCNSIEPVHVTGKPKGKLTL